MTRIVRRIVQGPPTPCFLVARRRWTRCVPRSRWCSRDAWRLDARVAATWRDGSLSESTGTNTSGHAQDRDRRSRVSPCRRRPCGHRARRVPQRVHHAGPCCRHPRATRRPDHQEARRDLRGRTVEEGAAPRRRGPRRVRHRLDWTSAGDAPGWATSRRHGSAKSWRAWPWSSASMRVGAERSASMMMRQGAERVLETTRYGVHSPGSEVTDMRRAAWLLLALTTACGARVESVAGRDAGAEAAGGSPPPISPPVTLASGQNTPQAIAVNDSVVAWGNYASGHGRRPGRRGGTRWRLANHDCVVGSARGNRPRLDERLLGRLGHRPVDEGPFRWRRTDHLRDRRRAPRAVGRQHLLDSRRQPRADARERRCNHPAGRGEPGPHPCDGRPTAAACAG